MDFFKPNLKYTPLEVEVENLTSTLKSADNTSSGTVDTDVIANKLMDHLALIKGYNDRLSAIDWLVDNAKKMSGNLTYSTNDQDMIRAIGNLGGDSNSVDLALFEKAIDTVIEGYKQQALVSLTGAAN